MPPLTIEERDDWRGSIIGPWLVVEGPFRDSRGLNRYRCLNVALDKVVGIASRKLCQHRNRMRREGIEPDRVDVWTLAEAHQKVELDTARRAGEGAA